MPYKDSEKAKIASRERKRRWQEKHRPADWKDMRGHNENHPKGAAHGRWNTGDIVGSNGYRKLRVGKGHPLADPNGYAYEHTVIWLAAGNAKPSDKESLHHVNGDQTDNRIENLVVMNRGEHSKEHGVEHDPQTGRFTAAGHLLDGVAHHAWPEVVG